MSRKKDFSLSKDFDYESDPKLKQIFGEYEAIHVSGHFFKSQLQYYIKIYKGVCGESEGINRVYSALQDYIRINVTDDDYSFAEEADRLKSLYLSVKQHSRELEEVNNQLDEAIDSWLDSINPEKPSPKDRAKDLEFVAQATLLANRREFLYETLMYTNTLMKGYLEYNDDSGNDDDNATLGAVELPVFPHIPTVEDFSQRSLEESKLMRILFNIIEEDAYPPIMMIHDCNNGNAIVRLWKKEDGEDKPCLFTVSKSDIYLEKIGYSGEKVIWPGLIEAAIALLGCSDDEIPYAILGPKLEEYDLDAIFGPNITPTYEISDSYNDMVNEYITCYFDTYSALLTTYSLLSEDTIEFTKLLFAVWEVIYALTCCFDKTFDNINPSRKFLRLMIAEYRKLVQDNPNIERMASKRIAILDTMEELNKLGEGESEDRKNPRRYFGKMLATKMADVALESNGGEKTQNNIYTTAERIMHNEEFNKLVAKTNVHTMRTATREMAASIYAKTKSLHN